VDLITEGDHGLYGISPFVAFELVDGLLDPPDSHIGLC
jgi:hypothetical protein